MIGSRIPRCLQFSIKIHTYDYLILVGTQILCVGDTFSTEVTTNSQERAEATAKDRIRQRNYSSHVVPVAIPRMYQIQGGIKYACKQEHVELFYMLIGPLNVHFCLAYSCLIM